MDFVISLPLFFDQKSDSYDSILVIVNYLTKMVYYKPVKITINTLELAEESINMVMQHHGLPNCIISDYRAIFMLKFWSSLCYFLGIKWKLLIAVYP